MNDRAIDKEHLHYLADDMYVIKDGKIVESGSVQEVFRAPKHPYTQYLMEPINAEELK